jgi:hypothetical protein
VGAGVAGVVFSEWALANPSAWGYVRPMIEENGGWASFITTPRGNNHAKAMYDMAKSNPNWFAEVSNVHSTGALTQEALDEALDEYQAIYGIDFGRALFDQEYWCSFSGAMIGAYWGAEINKAEREGRIRHFDIDPEHPVHTAWDLGIGDSTAIWFFQIVGSEIRVIDFYEANAQPISHYIDWIRSLPYKVADVWLPHDAKAKSLQTGRSMVEAFLQAGIKPRLVPNMGLLDGIEAARQVIPMCWFQETATYEGVEHLRGYSREWDERLGVFRPNPKHDSHSHASDAFRYLAIVAKKLKTQKTRQVSISDIPEAPKMYQFTLDMLWDTAPKQNVRIG